ncbi:ankyrin repeat and sterile alpha motif domain-containing protein 1B-like isoform X3 [Lytechinus pictus]|uniref:ankyrin repeat and sterile alpha motif domain-containing protein 1B-like isoform X3 n=1 Tax=Lytechinus pictus TaxID=7653 RepID=UPI0030B9E9F1
MSVMNGTLSDGLGKAKGDESVVGNLDDSSEWDQIESIMNSFGAGLVRESVYVRDYQQDFEKMFEGPGRPQSIGAWLDSLNLGQYENMLIANGFDHLDFIGGSIIEEQDLMDIGIVEEIHRKMILEATRCLPIMKPIGPGPEFTPKPASVSDWLRSLLLSDYITNFLENSITTMDRALELWEFELENVLEVPMLGHRKRILASLGDRRRSRHSSTIDIEISRPHSLDLTCSEDLELQIESFVGPEEREEIKRHTSQSSSLDIDLFKDYSKEVASPTRNSTSSTIPEEGALHPSEEEEFRTLIETTEQYARQNGDCASFKRTNERGMVESKKKEGGEEEEKGNGVHPEKKQGDTPGSQWMHPPDALIKGCCNYTSSYLGSSIIKELHGTESTREACTRLRRSAQHLQKMPAITLSINYGGVKFIDSKSKMVITEHEICNISCVAQDSNDLKTFAYITKDIQYEKLYCHVFTVKTVDLATEIIMTLGQAFEIAYKMLLKTTKGAADMAQPQQPIRVKEIQATADDDSDTASYEDTKL